MNTSGNRPDTVSLLVHTDYKNELETDNKRNVI